jgi:sucrose-6-phosphate hydrolase SacC (GH32 family)
LVKIEWKPETEQLLFDGASTSFDMGGKHLEIQMYVDGSVIEFFANGLAARTERFYYSGDKAPEIRLAIAGQTTDIERLSVWKITPVSPNRLTSDNYKI